MNSQLLVAALVTPLVGAVAALLVPTGRTRQARSPGRRLRKRASATDDTPTSDVQLVEPPPDPSAAERSGLTSRTLVRVAALVAAALWVAVALVGPSSAGSARAIGPIGPAAAGAALVLAAVGRPARRLPAAAAAFALTLATAGLAFGTQDGGAGWAVAGLAAAAVVICFANRKGFDGSLAPGALALAGTAALAGGLLRLTAGGGELNLPADASMPLDAGFLVVGGSTMVIVAASLRPRRAVGLLLPIALALGIPAAAVLGDAGDGVAVVLMLLAATTMTGWAASPRSPRGDLRPLVAALALSSLTAAAVTSSGVSGSGASIAGIRAAGVPAAWLLAAAAVITAVTLVPVAALSALPGAAALVVVLIADPEPAHLALVALTVAATVAGTVAVHRPPPLPHEDESSPPTGFLDPFIAALPALAAGTWLVVAPESWSWVGEVNLMGWTNTVAVGLAGGLIAAVAGLATGRLGLPRLPRLVGPDPLVATDDPPGSTWLALAAGVCLGLALIALLASSAGAS